MNNSQNFSYQQINQQIESLSQKENISINKLFAQKSLTEVMTEISDNAQKRGLTPEILESLLNDDK